MQQGLTFLYLNKSKPLQFITTTVMNDSTVIELNIPFLVAFYIFNCFLEILMSCICGDCFCVCHFCTLPFSVVCNSSNCTRANVSVKKL